MSSKFNYFAPKKTTQHSLQSTQYTFKHCKKIFECFKDGRMMWFCMRGSQTCLIKWCVKWFLCNKRIFYQKNYPVVFVMPYPIYHKNVSEIEFSIFMDRDLISTKWPRVFNTLNFFVRKCFHQKWLNLTVVSSDTKTSWKVSHILHLHLHYGVLAKGGMLPSLQDIK